MYLYTLATEQGFTTDAQCYLGRLYELGHGVQKDIKKAINLYREAAAKGNRVAQYYLGTCYEVGRGVPWDIDQAIRHYELAADNGLENAVVPLNRLIDQKNLADIKEELTLPSADPRATANTSMDRPTYFFSDHPQNTATNDASLPEASNDPVPSRSIFSFMKHTWTARTAVAPPMVNAANIADAVGEAKAEGRGTKRKAEIGRTVEDAQVRATKTAKRCEEVQVHPQQNTIGFCY